MIYTARNLTVAGAKAILKQKMDDGFIEPFDFEEWDEDELVVMAEYLEDQEQKRMWRDN